MSGAAAPTAAIEAATVESLPPTLLALAERSLARASEPEGTVQHAFPRE